MSAIPIEVESIGGDGTGDVGLSSSKVGDLKKKKNEDGGESGLEKSYLDTEQSVNIFNDTVLRQFIDNFLLEWKSNIASTPPKSDTPDKDQAASVLKAKDDNGISPINANASGGKSVLGLSEEKRGMMGLKYGCRVEDIISSLAIQYRGWKSVYYNPDRRAFLGVAPITLDQSLVRRTAMNW
ncbi:hypothetical protein GIB67_024259 [Kingdonia uniflora]|uniref:Uncharacterized protein n=1 Tax=Kingdonia uniflora TaxID=39325 RepID=A0A7J7LZV7_9MAGN|nr:hypothetical protein GIB67_024259 [Kingdonia uniflora]